VFPTRSLEGFCKAPVPKSVLAMSDEIFRDPFRAATGFPEPYAYQCRLACGPEASPENIDSLCHGYALSLPVDQHPDRLGQNCCSGDRLALQPRPSSEQLPSKPVAPMAGLLFANADDAPLV
jgi:hypothetical protein